MFKPGRSAQGRQPRDGYPALAAYLAEDADGETLVFRKFAVLTVRKLLHLESQLIDLEQQQRNLDIEAAGSQDHELRISLRSWSNLVDQAPKRSQERIRLELAEKIDVTLDRYHRALLLQARVAQLEAPGKAAIQACRIGLSGINGDDPRVEDASQYMFDPDFEDDLVALAPPKHKDALSGFLKRHWLGPKSSKHEQIRYFNHSSLTLLANTCSITIAAALLTVPIVVLYFVTNPDARLALVILFIVLFAIGLSISTSATRDAIFAACAAYTAVLVVFVSGDLANTKVDGKDA